jgi:RNA polymerase sigma factor (sigma-70 family)
MSAALSVFDRARLNKLGSDETLVDVRRRGATPAQLEELYRTHFERYSRVASAICRDPELGRDAVQAAFVTAVRERRSFRGTGLLQAWVWRIVVNEARRLARQPRLEPLEAAPEPEANGCREDPLGLRLWIAALPDRQREVLFLRYYADLDYRTVADVLGIEVGTVSATLSAAHQALRKRLEEVRR